MDQSNQLPNDDGNNHSSHHGEIGETPDEAADVAAVSQQNRAKEAADSAEAEQERAEGAADTAEEERDRAKGAADAGVAEQNRAKEAADSAEGEQERAEGAADTAEEERDRAKGAADAGVTEQIRAKQVADFAWDELKRAEAAADKADEERGRSKDVADAAASEKKRSIEAANAATAEQSRAKGAADTAAQKLQELNQTLENSITATLGGAFQQKSERSRWLDFLWLVVLMVGIVGILCIGYLRYGATANLIHERADISYIALQLLINLASMSGPIWLSWVATLRLAKTHAITEDYSYKAALAQAYQGYSTSVAEEDEFLKYRLFATVITQLDASPVRFVTEKHPATPFQDLMQQPWMEEVMKDETFKAKFVDWLKSRFKTTFKAGTSDEG